MLANLVKDWMSICLTGDVYLYVEVELPGLMRGSTAWTRTRSSSRTGVRVPR